MSAWIAWPQSKPAETRREDGNCSVAADLVAHDAAWTVRLSSNALSPTTVIYVVHSPVQDWACELLIRPDLSACEGRLRAAVIKHTIGLMLANGLHSHRTSAMTIQVRILRPEGEANARACHSAAEAHAARRDVAAMFHVKRWTPRSA